MPTASIAAPALRVALANGNVGRLVLPVNKSQVVELDSAYAELLVGSSDIADVLPLSDRSVYVLGKKVGTTNLSILDRDKRLLGVIDIEITLDAGLVQARIRESTGNADIVVSDNNGQLVLSGVVNDAPTVDRALQIATQFAPGAVINALDVNTSQQVMLKVKFIEATRSAGRELGIRWDAIGRRATFSSGWGTNTFILDDDGNLPIADLGSGTPYGILLASLVNGGVEIAALVKALETRGLIRSLAEPNLVALSGDTADFLAGGEYPVPVPNEDGIGIEYKNFGVGLAFTPTVLRDGQINLKIVPEVSQLDFNNAVQILGTTVPALTKRRASTTIELRDGQSFAIAGLFQTQSRREIAQIPWIGRMPILGALFRSPRFTNRETDLVIIVTPHLVQPGAPGDQIATPLDTTLPANDSDLFLHGELELPKNYTNYVERGGALKGPYGHMLAPEYNYSAPVRK